MINDTSKYAENILIEGYRSMPVWKKLRQVCQLNETVRFMALLRLRKQYENMNTRGKKLRLAALWLPIETMIHYFDWDPAIHGY